MTKQQFRKEKTKKLNKLFAVKRHLRKKVRHEAFACFRKRSLSAKLKQAKKVMNLFLRIRLNEAQIRIVLETPIPNYTKGGITNNCSNIVEELGQELILRRSECGDIPNPIHHIEFHNAGLVKLVSPKGNVIAQGIAAHLANKFAQTNHGYKSEPGTK